MGAYLINVPGLVRCNKCGGHGNIVKTFNPPVFVKCEACKGQGVPVFTYKVGDKVNLYQWDGVWVEGVVTHVYEDGTPRVRIGKHEAPVMANVEPKERRFPLVVNPLTAYAIEGLAGDMSVSEYLMSLIRADAQRRGKTLPEDMTPRRGKRGNGRRRKANDDHP